MNTGAVCYAEIGTIIPRNGAEIAYMKEGIGSVHARTGDILAYLFTWTITFILKPSSLAVLTLTFSQYFLSGIMDGKFIIDKILILPVFKHSSRLWSTRRISENVSDFCSV